MRWRITAPFIKIIAIILLLLELHFCHIELLGLINPIFWHTEKPRNAATFVHDPYLRWKITKMIKNQFCSMFRAILACTIFTTW